MDQPTRKALQSRVIEALARACNQEPQVIKPERKVAEVGVDSLSMTSVIADMESALDIEFKSEELERFFEVESIGDIVDLIAEIVEREKPNGAHLNAMRG